MQARLSINLQKIIIEPDFPYLADETTEPRPDMSIKIAALTVI